MGLWVVAILVALLCEEASLVHGDIGTANSYNPPYTRKQTLYQVKCVFMEVLVFNHLLFLQLLGVMGTGKISFHLAIYLFQWVKACGTMVRPVGDVIGWGAWVELKSHARMEQLMSKWLISAQSGPAPLRFSCPTMLLQPFHTLLAWK